LPVLSKGGSCRRGNGCKLAHVDANKAEDSTAVESAMDIATSPKAPSSNSKRSSASSQLELTRNRENAGFLDTLCGGIEECR